MAKCLGRFHTEMVHADGLPTIVAGDLNSTPAGFPQSSTDLDGHNAIDVFDRSHVFRRLPIDLPMNNESLTYDSVKPTQVIDWILIPRDWRYVEYVVYPSQLSDHRLLYTDVEFK